MKLSPSSKPGKVRLFYTGANSLAMSKLICDCEANWGYQVEV
jgi:hypothetical protein